MATPVPSDLGVRLPATPAPHSCERSKARKTGAQLRDNRKSAKNDAKCVKSPASPPSSARLEVEPFSVAQRECPLSPAITEPEAPLPLKRINWSSQASIAAESGTNTTCTTRTSATRKTRNNCGTTAVFCTLNDGLSLNTTGMSTTLSRLQLWELDCLPQLCTYNTTTLSMYCNRRISGTDHRNLPLRHDRGGNDITAKTVHLAMHTGSVSNVQVSPVSSSTQLRGP